MISHGSGLALVYSAAFGVWGFLAGHAISRHFGDAVYPSLVVWAPAALLFVGGYAALLSFG